MIKLNIKSAEIKTLIFQMLLDQADNDVDSLFSQGVDAQFIDSLRHVSSSDSIRAAHMANVPMEVTLSENHLTRAFMQLANERNIRKLQEYFLRNGATSEMISNMFKASAKETKAARHIFPTRKKGRPPMPDQFEREAMHQQWALVVKANPRNLTREHLHTVHQSFERYSLATLWAVINEFGPAADSSGFIDDRHRSKQADVDAAWQGGSRIHRLDC